MDNSGNSDISNNTVQDISKNVWTEQHYKIIKHVCSQTKNGRVTNKDDKAFLF